MPKDIYETLEQLRTTTNPVTRWSLKQIVNNWMDDNKIPEPEL